MSKGCVYFACAEENSAKVKKLKGKGYRCAPVLAFLPIPILGLMLHTETDTRLMLFMIFQKLICRRKDPILEIVCPNCMPVLCNICFADLANFILNISIRGSP